MTKIYQVQYTYTERYCSPDPNEWDRVTKTLCTTMDESLAIEVRDNHNATAQWPRIAEIKSHEMTSR